MEYIKIRFSKDFDRLDSRFERTLEDAFRSMGPMFSLSECKWKPQMDMYETHEEIIILAEIAGINKENLGIEINSRAVRIYGNRTEMSRVEDAIYKLAEIQYGIFERILFFSSPIDIDKVTASYLNGFLKIRLTKLQLEKNTQ